MVMKFTVRAMGEMQQYLGGPRLEVRLPDGARLSNLLLYLDRRLGRRFPEHLWDASARRFRGPVVIMIDKQAITDPNTPLSDGQEVTIHKVLVGG